MGGVLAAIVIIILIVLGIQLLFGIAGLIWAVLAWMLAGMIAGRLLRGRGYGPVMDILLGIAGGAVGSLVLGLLRLDWIGNIWIIGNIVVGVIGAIILVWIVRLLGNRDFAA